MQDSQKYSFLQRGYALLLGIFLSGCTTIPDLGDAPKPRSNLENYQALDVEKFEYPQQDWWKTYNDSQLATLIEDGLRQAPSILEASTRIQKANALGLLAGASLVPATSVNGSITKYRQSYNNGVSPQFVPHGFQNAGNLTFNVDYEIDFWLKNSNNLTAAVSDIESEKLMFEQTKIMLSTSIASTYAILAQLYEELDVAEEAVAVRTKTLQLFTKRYQNGIESESSVDQASSNQSVAEAGVLAIQENIKLTCNAIAALTGNTPDYALKIQRPCLANINTYAIPDAIPADLIGRRPDVMAAKLTLEAASHRIDAAKAGFYPNINLKNYLGFQSLGGFDAFFKSTALVGLFGPAIHLPIFDGRRIESNYRISRADYESQLATYEATIIQALREVADAINSGHALKKRLQKISNAVQAAERAYNVAKNRYHGGLATYLEVLRAEDNLIAVKREMADIKARAFVLDVGLIKALGGGFIPKTRSK